MVLDNLFCSQIKTERRVIRTYSKQNNLQKRTTFLNWRQLNVLTCAHEGTRPCNKRLLVVRTCPTNSLQEAFRASSRRDFFQKFKLVWIRGTSRMDRSWSLRPDFEARMASSHNGTCPRDLSQRLFPSCVPNLIMVKANALSLINICRNWVIFFRPRISSSQSNRRWVLSWKLTTYRDRKGYCAHLISHSFLV